MDEISSGRVIYTTKEILDGINEKLARSQVLLEQHDRRMMVIENRVDQHEKILSDQIPELRRTLEELNVQKQVEAALDSRKVRGVGTTDRIVASAIGLCILSLAALSYLPHILH